MPFDWRFRNFKRDPQPFLNGAVIDAENARNNLVQNAGNGMEGYTPLESTLAAQAMEGYKPVVPATQSQLAAGASQAMQGYTPNSVGRPSVPNNMHGGMGQPDLEGYGESLQAASDAAGQAQAREQQIADIQSQIKALQTRIAENQAKLKNWNGDDVVNKVAALEARKFFSQDPTSIWRWKVDRDEARRIAKEEKDKNKQLAKTNVLIEANNTLDSMIINDSLDTPTKNAMLSKLADVKSNLEKNGFDTSRVNSMISKLKGNGEQTTREQAKTDWKGLKGKPDLTSNEIQTALDNPDMNWDPDERKEAENLRDKLKKHEAATQDVKNMKSWVEKTYGTKWHTLSPRLQETYQRLWKNRKGKK